MFTGIIEALGTVTAIHPELGNKTFWISSPISHDLKTDQSVSHNGVCLTVEESKNGNHRVTAIHETLIKSNLVTWKLGSVVNLERCMQLNGRLDGHMVQGHVDTTAECLRVKEMEGSRQYQFRIPNQFDNLIIEKGSICLNGISLTIFNVSDDVFEVAIIPYTYEHTNIKEISVGSVVNIEFDVIGKYVTRYLSLSK
jgi:riboflavin synthase